MTIETYCDRLRSWAKGNRRLEAAVMLLVNHRVWVDRGFSLTKSGPFPGARLFWTPTDDAFHGGRRQGSGPSPRKQW